MSRADDRKKLADSFASALEQDQIPWNRPWNDASAGPLLRPINPSTDKPYRGGNAISLMVAAAEQGFDDPRWLTFKQAQALDAQVRKGERGTRIEFWQPLDRAAKDAEIPNNPADSATKPDTPNVSSQQWMVRTYTVFNAAQIDGLPARQVSPKPTPWEIEQRAENIIAQSGAAIEHRAQDSAYYAPDADKIVMPQREQFPSPSGYYGTLLHEIGHWTGHPSRLDRETLREYARDPEMRAREELRAELASVFLQAELQTPTATEEHKAYIQHWAKALRNDPNEFWKAAADAQRAADVVLALDCGLAIEEALAQAKSPATALSPAKDKGGQLENQPDRAVPRSNGVDGSTPSNADMVAAQQIARLKIGPAVTLHEAQTSGNTYRGEIVAETARHYVQKLSPSSAVAHPKALTGELKVGAPMAIAYFAGKAGSMAIPERDSARARGRQLGR